MTDLELPSASDIKALPPVWFGIAFGGAAAGAAVFPTHRVLAGTLVAACVLLLAHNVTKPCCAACGDATNGHPPIRDPGLPRPSGPGGVFSDDAPIPTSTPQALFTASAAVRSGGAGCVGCGGAS